VDSAEQLTSRNQEFLRETGELTIRRWKTAITLYLVFAAAGDLLEWQYYGQRGRWGSWLLLAQGVVVAAMWVAYAIYSWHPGTSWATLAGNVSICFLLALHHIDAGTSALYLLLKYQSFMLVTSALVPWGPDFQLRQNFGIVAAFMLALAMGVTPGLTPTYDYSLLAAAVVFSAIGAHYVDQYRRKLVAQATALRSANEQLETASRIRTDFLRGLSHDMRTPLSVIIGYAEILNTRSDPPSLHDGLHSINREAWQLLHLVDGILDLARLESGRLPFHRECFSLAETLSPLRETTQDLLANRNIRLNWSIPAELAADSDPTKVREVVRNLLSNAVKYTEAGEVGISAAPKDGGTEIVVSDTGVGIPPDKLDVIFDPFRQLTSSNKLRAGGFGFGLYLVKLFSDFIGARLSVESCVGTGTTFSFWVPPEPPEEQQHVSGGVQADAAQS